MAKKESRKNKTQQGKIVVTGDVTMDWNLAQKPGDSSKGRSWLSDTMTAASWQRGGAALVGDLIEKVAARIEVESGSAHEIIQTNAADSAVLPSDTAYNHSFAFWKQFDGRSWCGDKKVWRMVESFGMSCAINEENCPVHTWQKITGDDPDSPIIVLDDAGYGFRDHKSLWPEAIVEEGKKPWIILKMSHPVCEGKLFDCLIKNHSDRLIVLLTANDLRHCQIQLSKQLSWERTTGELIHELRNNHRVNQLMKCAHVVVSFLTAGAVVLSKVPGAGPNAKLLFDPIALEGQWEEPGCGSVFGYTTIMTSAIAGEIMSNVDNPDIISAVGSGVLGMRKLFERGYARGETIDNHISFPHESIAEILTKSLLGSDPQMASPLQCATIPFDPPADTWSIIHDKYSSMMDKTARDIAQLGLAKVLKDVPMASFKALSTVDRREIESFRNVQRLMLQYCQDQVTQPLSIAVFGPPGSGKSFGVKQIAKAIGKGKIEKIEFNLSQLTSPSELNGAFHQVRDIALTGKIPLVFWDEFDTTLAGQKYGWLRYFLAPMQDGNFQEGQITHPIGKSIFVFAGGTAKSFVEFGEKIRKVEETHTIKGTDFASRLKGFLNILGPNPQHLEYYLDEQYILRRAVLLRALLYDYAPDLFEGGKRNGALRIDPGVLRAFLHAPKFKHGARSMASIIAMSMLQGSACYERASLPSKDQLESHVEGRMFLSLVEQISLHNDVIEELADAAHELWRVAKTDDQWKYGLVRDDENKLHPWLKDYKDLPEEAKEANRVTVGNIPRKLAHCGFMMTCEEGAIAVSEEEYKKEREKMAEFEHKLWMEDKISRGYEPGDPDPTDCKRYQFLNPNLKPWDELDEETKNLDRYQVDAIPEILSQAEYKVVKVEE